MVRLLLVPVQKKITFNDYGMSFGLACPDILNDPLFFFLQTNFGKSLRPQIEFFWFEGAAVY